MIALVQRVSPGRARALFFSVVSRVQVVVTVLVDHEVDLPVLYLVYGTVASPPIIIIIDTWYTAKKYEKCYQTV